MATVYATFLSRHGATNHLGLSSSCERIPHKLPNDAMRTITTPLSFEDVFECVFFSFGSLVSFDATRRAKRLMDETDDIETVLSELKEAHGAIYVKKDGFNGRAWTNLATSFDSRMYGKTFFDFITQAKQCHDMRLIESFSKNTNVLGFLIAWVSKVDEVGNDSNVCMKKALDRLFYISNRFFHHRRSVGCDKVASSDDDETMFEYVSTKAWGMRLMVDERTGLIETIAFSKVPSSEDVVKSHRDPLIKLIVPSDAIENATDEIVMADDVHHTFPIPSSCYKSSEKTCTLVEVKMPFYTSMRLETHRPVGIANPFDLCNRFAHASRVVFFASFFDAQKISFVDVNKSLVQGEWIYEKLSSLMNEIDEANAIRASKNARTLDRSARWSLLRRRKCTLTDHFRIIPDDLLITKAMSFAQLFTLDKDSDRLCMVASRSEKTDGDDIVVSFDDHVKYAMLMMTYSSGDFLTSDFLNYKQMKATHDEIPKWQIRVSVSQKTFPLSSTIADFNVPTVSCVYRVEPSQMFSKGSSTNDEQNIVSTNRKKRLENMSHRSARNPTNSSSSTTTTTTTTFEPIRTVPKRKEIYETVASKRICYDHTSSFKTREPAPSVLYAMHVMKEKKEALDEKRRIFENISNGSDDPVAMTNESKKERLEKSKRHFPFGNEKYVFVSAESNRSAFQDFNVGDKYVNRTYRGTEGLFPTVESDTVVASKKKGTVSTDDDEFYALWPTLMVPMGKDGKENERAPSFFISEGAIEIVSKSIACAVTLLNLILEAARSNDSFFDKDDVSFEEGDDGVDVSLSDDAFKETVYAVYDALIGKFYRRFEDHVLSRHGGTFRDFSLHESHHPLWLQTSFHFLRDVFSETKVSFVYHPNTVSSLDAFYARHFFKGLSTRRVVVCCLVERTFVELCTIFGVDIVGTDFESSSRFVYVALDLEVESKTNQKYFPTHFKGRLYRRRPSLLKRRKKSSSRNDWTLISEGFANAMLRKSVAQAVEEGW